MINLSFVDFCFFVGFFGDGLLQVIANLRGDIANLKKYFLLHGSLESMFIAGGMMYLFGFLYLKIIKKLSILYPNLYAHLHSKLYSNVYLFIYGGILDIIWRQFHLFPSLDNTYYTAMNKYESFVWGGIPMVLPNILFSLFFY